MDWCGGGVCVGGGDDDGTLFEICQVVLSSRVVIPSCYAAINRICNLHACDSTLGRCASVPNKHNTRICHVDAHGAVAPTSCIQVQDSNKKRRDSRAATLHPSIELATSPSKENHTLSNPTTCRIWIQCN